MANDGLASRSGGGRGGPYQGNSGAWSWRPDYGARGSPLALPPPGASEGRSSPSPPRKPDPAAGFTLAGKTLPPAAASGPASAAVTNTLERLARAREMIAAGGTEETETVAKHGELP